VAAITVALVLTALPEAIRWGAVRWLDRHGVAATIDDIDLNLFTATAAVEGVRLGDGVAWSRIAVVGSWGDLIHHRLRLERLEAAGVRLDVVRNPDGGWRIGGQPLPASSAAPPAAEERAAAGRRWGFGVDVVEIRELHLRYRDPAAPHEIVLHHLHLGPLATWAAGEATPLALAATVDGGELTVGGEATPFAAEPGGTVAIGLDHFPLARMAPEVAAVARLDGDLTTHLHLTSQRQAAGLAATVEGDVAVAELAVRPATVAATVAAGRVDWKGTVAIGGEAQVAATGDVALRDLRLTPAGEGPPPVALAEATLTGINVAGPRALAADHLRLAGLEIALVRSAKGRLPLLAALRPQGEPAPSPADAPPASAEPPPLHLRLGDVELTGDSRIEVTDRTVDPPFVITLTPVALTLGPLDTAHPERPTPLRLHARAGKYATLALEGSVTPLAPQAAATVEGGLKQIDLAPLTGYTARAVGYRLKSGHLDAELAVKVAAGRLDAKSHWQVNRLEMARLKQAAGDPLSDRLGIPVNTALALLRDRDDNIRLDVPVTGTLAEARVGMGSALRQVAAKATVKAVKTAVLHYLAPLSSPLGLALAAGKVVSLATALRFDPIPFAPGASTLPETTAPYLAQIAARLTDRPRLRLSVCGLATRADLLAGEEAEAEQAVATGVEDEVADHPPAAATAAQAGADEPETTVEPAAPAAGGSVAAAVPPPLTDGQRGALRALATARGAAVKGALVARGIDPERLFTCSPEIDPEPAATPRVDLSL